MDIYRQGLIVAVLLAVMTILEYLFAGEVADATVRFSGLAVTALAKAGLIGYYFMHVYQLWKSEAEEH